MTAPQNAFRRVVANATWLGGAELFGRLLSLAAVIHLSRTLLPGGMGFVDFGIAVFGLSQTIVVGGVEALAARRAARTPRGLDRLAGTTLVISWIYGGAVLAVLAAVALLAEAGSTSRAALLFGLAAMLRPLGLRFAFWGREELATVAIGNVVSQAAFLGLCLSLVASRADLSLVPAIWFGKELVRAVLPFSIFVRRHGMPRWRLRRSRLRVWLAASFPMMLARLARGALLGLDILLLGPLATLSQVGLYGAAFRIPGLLSALAMMFHTAAFPAVARARASGGAARLRLIHGQMVHVVVGAGLPAVVAVSLVSQPLVTTIFGDAFRESAPLLQLLIWKAIVLALGGLYRNVVLAHRPMLDLRVTGTGIAVAASSMLLLIPVLGASGAAIGALLGESALLLGYALAARGWVEVVPLPDGAWLLRLVTGLGLVVLCAYWVPPDRPVLQIVAVLGTAAAAALLVNQAVARRLWRELRASE